MCNELKCSISVEKYTKVKDEKDGSSNSIWFIGSRLCIAD